MIYKFRIRSDENKKFLMEIEIRPDQTFYALHEIIQHEAEYDNSQLASFYLVNDRWEKQKEITLLDMSQGSNPDILVMDQIKLSKYLTKEKQKLMYVFDFFSERGFYIELSEILDSSSHRKFPVCTVFQGDAPPQIRIGGKNKKPLFSGTFDDIHEDEHTHVNHRYIADDEDGFGGCDDYSDSDREEGEPDGEDFYRDDPNQPDDFSLEDSQHSDYSDDE
jgi:hypothetical protein